MWRKCFLASVLFGCIFMFLVYSRADFQAANRRFQLLLDERINEQGNRFENCVENQRDKTCYPLGSSSDVLRPDGNEAFFMETSFSPSLNYRQACSIESLALTNPNLTINVFMTTSPIDFNSTTVSILTRYPNINIFPIAAADFFVNTPLEHWFFRTDWFTTQYPVEHLADALRYITLYKYGGYYFDLDVIAMRPLTEFRNFSASPAPGGVAIGAMHFDYGHPVIVALVEEFRVSYNKKLWAHAGPGAIARVLKKFCRVNNLAEAVVNGARPCANFTIYTPESFYPIHYSNWKQYFNNGTDSLIEKWDKTKLMGAHVWNRLSAGHPVYKHSKQLFSELARLYCPSIYSAAPDPF